MATTYEKIATTTLSSAASTITFSSIAASWTDLRLILNATPSYNANVDINFNSDTGSNYSRTTLYGDGTSVYSGGNANLPFWRATINMQSGNPSLLILDIFSYAGSNYKTGLSTFSGDFNGSGNVYRNINLWRSTSAITTIDLGLGGANFNVGSTATLYGIKAA
jgi:hypothetical protein